MKTILTLLCLLALNLAAAETSNRSAFELRLVVDKPSADSEPMTMSSLADGKNGKEVVNVQKTPLLDHTSVKDAAVRKSRTLGTPEVEVRFTDDGAKRFREITRQNVDKRLAMIVDGKLVSTPMIRSEIPAGRAMISGNFSEQQARQLAAVINNATKK